MATAPLKSQPLHNFNLPPLFKMGTSGNHHRYRQPPSSSAGESHAQPPPSLAADSDYSELELEMNNSDLVTRDHGIGAGSTRNHPLNSAEKLQNKAPETENNSGEIAEGVKPWNLRPRKATSAKFTVNGELLLQDDARGCGVVGMQRQRVKEERERPRKEKRKLWIALSKDEIEEDVFAMTGSRPSRRPRKRPKNVQKQLDCTFPGLWLVGMSADGYR